jgi:predicted nuclease of predicted toxin-antitoxin system
MSQLFIAIYLDEDVDVLVARLIQARGFSATTVRDKGLREQDDAFQLAIATQQQRVLVTHNRVDFENLAKLYFETGQNHAGMILAVRRPPHEIARRLLILLNHLTADEMVNQIRYI